MNAADFIGEPCECPECYQAQVTDKPLRRDPMTPKWLHGHELRRWYEAKAQFEQQARAAVGGKGRHAGGFEKLA